MTPEEILAEEAAGRQRAGFAALAAAVLTILGVVLTTLGQPSTSQFDDKIVTVVDAMGRTANGQPVPPGRISAFAVEVGQHPAVPIAGAIIYGFGSLAIFFAMAYLFRAARARRPGMPQIALILAAVGSVGFGVGRAVSEVARYLGAHSFVDAVDKTNSAASDALSPTATLVGQLIWESSALALGFGIAIISLNAMRVGLLTRFMGVLGVIVGVAVAPILPIDQQGIIRVFWLAALGMLFLGRLPSGTPKAWATGEAEPWPTQQQLREQRAAARGDGDGDGDGDAADEGGERDSARASRRGAATPPPQAPSPRRPDPAAPGSEHSASRKKKRKRRS
jgi:MFS family permease